MSFGNDCICPRLIDYIAIIGLRQNNSDINCTTPEILRRYPSIDYSNSYLPNDVVYFCQPDGCYKTISSSNQSNQPNAFVFSLTEKETGCIRFCVCLNFLRSTRKRSQKQLNKGAVDENANEVAKDCQCKRIRSNSQSLISLLIISHHPFFRGFEDSLYILKALVDRLDKIAKRRSKGRDSIWSALLGSSKESFNSYVYPVICEIETWIFKLLSAPVPVPGINKINLYLLPETVIKPLIFALPSDGRLSFIDFSLQSIFELIGVEFALRIFIAVLLEYKVLLQSNNYSTLSRTVLAAKSLFYPLEYMFPVIPILPSHMPMSEQLIMAPSPFIFGISRNFLSDRKNFRIPEDVWLFDLDNKMFSNNGSNSLMSPSNIDEDLSLPPTDDFVILIKRIKQALRVPKKPHYGSISSFSDITAHSEVPFHKSSLTDLSSLDDSDSSDIAIRVAMIRFFNSPNIMGDYDKFTRVLKLFPRPVVAFQMESFIKSRKCPSDFVNKLVQTQAAEYFGEWSITSQSRVFSKIKMGKYDPYLIGDKSKWFDHQLGVIPFKVYSESGNGILYNFMNLDSNEEFYYQKSGSESEDGSEVSTSSVDMIGNGNDRNDSGISGCQIRGNDMGTIYCPPHLCAGNVVEDSTYIKSEVSYSSECFFSDADDIFVKTDDEDLKSPSPIPNTLPIKEIITSQPSTTSINSHCGTASDSDSITSVSIISETFEQHSFPTESSPNNIKNLYHKFINNTSRNLSGLLNSSRSPPKPNLNSELLKTNLKSRFKFTKKSSINRDDLTNRIKEAHYQSRSTSNLFFPENTVDDRTYTNNQDFIRKVTDELLRGLYPNIITRYKFRNLVEREIYRNLILSKISKNLDRDNSQKRYVDDVVADSEDQFAGLVWICGVLIDGIVESYTKGVSEGYGSVFVLLEMIHTHNIELQGRGTAISSSSSVSDAPTERSRCVPNSPNTNVIGSLGNPIDINGEEYENVEAIFNQKEYYVVRRRNDTNFTDDEGSSTYSRNKLECFLDVTSVSASRQNPFDLRSDTSSIVSAQDYGNNNLQHTNDQLRSPETRKYRYFNNQLYWCETSERTSLPTQGRAHGNSISSIFLSNTPPSSENSHLPSLIVDVIQRISQNKYRADQNKLFIYQKLVSENERSQIWDNIAFWEDVFYDSVCQEREILGMDYDPTGSLDRYKALEVSDRKKLERNEDKLLGIAIYNLVAFMLLTGVEIKYIKLIARRMTAKSHITLEESRNIDKLTESLKYLEGNDVSLLVPLSRLNHVKTFSVYYGTKKEGDLHMAEVHKDCLLLRTMAGIIVERWWLDMFIKCTCKCNTICISRIENHRIVMTNLYCKNSKELIEEVQRNSQRSLATEEMVLSKFNVTDDATNCDGFLTISKNSITFSSSDYEWSVNIIHVTKCFTRAPDKFIVEVVDPNTNAISKRIFKSHSYNQIAQRVLTLFSILSTECSTSPLSASPTPSETRQKSKNYTTSTDS